MKKIRIGKDINLRWEILTNGEAIPLEGRDLKLVLINPLNAKTELDFSVNFNVIEARYKGTDQQRLGTYRMTLWENYQNNYSYANLISFSDTICN